MAEQSERDSCGALMKQIHDALEKNANNAMRPQGVTMAQMNVLLELNRAEGGQLPLKSLEQALRVAQSTAAGVVARLEQKAFVEGLGDHTDRRIKMVRITDLGVECCRIAYQNMEQAETKLLSGLTEAERSIFHTLLQKVRDSLQ